MNYELPDEMTVEADGQVRIVTLNRPDELNCMNKNLHWAMANVWRQLSMDADARVVTLNRGRAGVQRGRRPRLDHHLPRRPRGP